METTSPEAAAQPSTKIEPAYKVKFTLRYNEPVDETADDGLGRARNRIKDVAEAIEKFTGLSVETTANFQNVRGAGPQPNIKQISSAIDEAAPVPGAVGGTSELPI